MKSALTLTWGECREPGLLQRVHDAGFDGINFTYDENLFSGADPEARLRQIRENLDAAGLACPQVILPCPGHPASLEHYDEASESPMEFALRTMPVLGAKWGAVQPLSPVNPGFCREKVMTDNLVRFRQYLELAERYDVNIAVENPLPVQDQPEQRFCGEPEELCAFVDRLEHPRAGVCWNIGHANQLGKDCFGRDTATPFDHTAAVQLLGSRVKTIHASDNFGDGHLRLPPGVGKLDWFQPVQWGSLLRTLLKKGFAGFFTLDCDLNQGRRFPGMEAAFITLCGRSAAAYAAEAEQN